MVCDTTYGFMPDDSRRVEVVVSDDTAICSTCQSTYICTCVEPYKCINFWQDHVLKLRVLFSEVKSFTPVHRCYYDIGNVTVLSYCLPTGEDELLTCFHGNKTYIVTFTDQIVK